MTEPRTQYGPLDPQFTDAITAALTEPKPWWQSRRQWGLLIWLVGWLLGRAGVEVDTAAITAFVPQMIEIIGAIVGVWGAIRAERPIDMARVLPGVSLPGLRR
jgi:hypothetical protein